MDLKRYYQKIRDVEATVAENSAVVVSLETADGGKPGVFTEVPRRVAAKMVVDGAARLATPKEAEEVRERQAEAQRSAEQSLAANRVHLTVLPTSELNRLRAVAESPKE